MSLVLAARSSTPYPNPLEDLAVPLIATEWKANDFRRLDESALLLNENGALLLPQKQGEAISIWAAHSKIENGKSCSPSELIAQGYTEMEGSSKVFVNNNTGEMTVLDSSLSTVANLFKRSKINDDPEVVSVLAKVQAGVLNFGSSIVLDYEQKLTIVITYPESPKVFAGIVFELDQTPVFCSTASMLNDQSLPPDRNAFEAFTTYKRALIELEAFGTTFEAELSKVDGPVRDLRSLMNSGVSQRELHEEMRSIYLSVIRDSFNLLRDTISECKTILIKALQDLTFGDVKEGGLTNWGGGEIQKTLDEFAQLLRAHNSLSRIDAIMGSDSFDEFFEKGWWHPTSKSTRPTSSNHTDIERAFEDTKASLIETLTKCVAANLVYNNSGTFWQNPRLDIAWKEFLEIARTIHPNSEFSVIALSLSHNNHKKLPSIDNL